MQRLLPLLLVGLRQLDAPVERVKHTLELIEGRERLQGAGGEVKMELGVGMGEGYLPRVVLAVVSESYLLLAVVHGPSVMQVVLRG